MSDEASKIKVSIGVLFSPKEMMFEVEGDADEFITKIESRLSGGAKSISFDDGEGKRIIVPIDKLSYVEIDAGKKSQSIGFNF